MLIQTGYTSPGVISPGHVKVNYTVTFPDVGWKMKSVKMTDVTDLDRTDIPVIQLKSH